MIKTTLLAAALCLTLSSCHVSAQDNTPQFAPLQEAHNGLWFDPDNGGNLVQVYPFVRADVPGRVGAFVAYNFFIESEANPDKSWQAFLYNDFAGFSRVAAEDTVIGVGDPGTDVSNRPNWTLSQVGATCDALKFTRRDENGVVTDSFNLVRIVAANTSAECYTCPEVAAGPFPPLCRR